MGSTICKICDSKTINQIVPKENDDNNDDIEKTTKVESPQPKPKKKKSIDDFTLNSKLGEGGYGSVYWATHKHNKKEYAIKVIKKKLFKDVIRIKDAMNEKDIMVKASNPFIVKLHYAFQDKRNLYYAMDYVQGGILLRYMKYSGRFTEEVTRFYIAQVLVALKYLHEEKDIVYRDLKPDNILVDEFGYIKLTDFGLSSIGVERLTSICGTYEYIAPEILRGEEYTGMVDFFSLGCLMFEMLYGYSPFNVATNPNRNHTIIKNILKNEYTFDPAIEISETAKDLIRKLLNPQQDARLGANGALEIQQHKFFDSYDWDGLYKKKLRAPMKVDVFTGFNNRQQRFKDPASDSILSMVLGGFEYDEEDER